MTWYDQENHENQQKKWFQPAWCRITVQPYRDWVRTKKIKRINQQSAPGWCCGMTIVSDSGRFRMCPAYTRRLEHQNFPKRPDMEVIYLLKIHGPMAGHSAQLDRCYVLLPQNHGFSIVFFIVLQKKPSVFHCNATLPLQCSKTDALSLLSLLKLPSDHIPHFQRRPNGLYLPSNIGVNPASGKAIGYSVDIPVYPINILIYLYSHTCW